MQHIINLELQNFTTNKICCMKLALRAYYGALGAGCKIIKTFISCKVNVRGWGVLIRNCSNAK